MLKNQKSIQQPKRDSRNDKQIHRSDAVGVIAKKGLPSLRWRSPWPHHVLRYGRLPDIDTEHENFTVDPRCTPKWVRNAHVSNELTNLKWCLWSGRRALSISSAN